MTTISPRFFLLIFILLYKVSFCQTQDLYDNQVDSLKKYSYDELKEKYYEIEEKSISKAKVYAKYYLAKSKLENDTINIARGYRFVSYTSENDDAIKYSDSIINITKNSDNKYFPTVGYLLKAYYYYDFGNYKLTLNSLLEAYPYALRKNNVYNLIFIENLIANLKTRWGRYDEALELYKNVHKKILLNNDLIKSEKYKFSLNNLSICYLRNKKIDSAFIFINKGIKYSLFLGDDKFYNKNLFVSGIGYYYRKEYKRSNDSILKSISKLRRSTSKAIAYYFLGKNYKELNKEDLSEKYLNRMDSIFKKTNDEFPELIDGYQLLIERARLQKNLKKQLYFVNQLIKADSMIDRNYVEINDMITKRHDIPLLMKEKEKLIASLVKSEKLAQSKVFVLIFCGLGLLFIVVFLYRKNVRYKKRYQELIENKELIKENKKKNVEEKKRLNIPEEVIQEVLEKLNVLEEKHFYLDVNLNVYDLAKKINTNTSYLSKIINTYRGKNFTSYINELRINYSIKRLKKDKKFRLYTVKAIANEWGFNKTQSYTNAFKKLTGITPSYFLNELGEV